MLSRQVRTRSIDLPGGRRLVRARDRCAINSNNTGFSLSAPRRDRVDVYPHQIQVTTGIINTAPRSVHRVSRIRHHEEYARNDSAINDIALLKITPPFVYNEFVAPIRLPYPHLFIPAGTSGVVAGWGSTSYPKLNMPSRLQKLDVTITSENFCKEAYMMLLRNIYTVHLCTFETTDVWAGSCTGDSGSPLTVNNDVLVGIVSWSRKKGRCGSHPNVYTRVSEFIDWILETVFE
ncbi:mite allergen Der p 3-like isoform X2 [Phymastichus coffea]|uniref:mite allergen Der p 3-like isoform X2 n=1 Tax=Phymastichus coffea TaxID=108790 RepID=UPI00273BCFF6|nr:mite allergen Der p 3-like isoform X2 [Phymastichus coffea]